jgi:hypothetical protein
LGASNDTVGFVKFDTPNTAVTSYTRFSKAITYFSTANPVNSYWILSSSDGINPVVNSALFIDDIDLIFNTSGLSNELLDHKIKVVNTMVTNELIVESSASEVYSISLTDVTGKQIERFNILPGTNHYNLSRHADGIYLFLVSDSGNNVMNGKIIKSH